MHRLPTRLPPLAPRLDGRSGPLGSSWTTWREDLGPCPDTAQSSCSGIRYVVNINEEWERDVLSVHVAR